jgi:hypothetical protein
MTNDEHDKFCKDNVYICHSARIIDTLILGQRANRPLQVFCDSELPTSTRSAASPRCAS